MRTIASEFGHNYGSYSFGYTLHLALETGDDLSNVYTSGYLPESAKRRDENLFYMARSVRLPVASYVPSSENRRIFKKFDGLYTEMILSNEDLRKDKVFHTLFLRYFKERHGDIVMTKERFDAILDRDLPLRAVCYYENDTLIAAVLEVTEGSFIHFWFSCFEPSLVHTSLGMWLMQDAARRAQSEKRDYLYLGTAYGEKAKYKMNIPNLEYWNGTTWTTDERLLKEKIRRDDSRSTTYPGDFESA